MAKTGKYRSYARQAKCSNCGIKYALRKDGMVRKHVVSNFSMGLTSGNEIHCPGSGLLPLEES